MQDSYIIAFKILHLQQKSYLASLVSLYVSRDHCDLLLPCQYVFLHEKLKWQGPSLSHPLPRTFGIRYYHYGVHCERQCDVYQFIHFRSSCFQKENQASSFFKCLSRILLSIHRHYALWYHHIPECKLHQMHHAAQLTRSSWTPTISLDSHQNNYRQHSGARVNAVLLIHTHFSFKCPTLLRLTKIPMATENLLVLNRVN